MKYIPDIIKNFKWKRKYSFLLGLGLLGVFVFRYIAPFGAVVNYQLVNTDNKIETIQGIESVDTFKKTSNVLLKIPQQVIRKNIITFSVKPLYKNLTKVGVFFRFKGNPHEVKIGIRGNQTSPYIYKSLFNELLNSLPLQTEGEVSLWQKKHSFSSITDFEKNVPTKNLIGYYMFDPSQLGLPLSTPTQSASATVDTTLRGTNTFYVKVTSSPFILSIEKQDANQYAGEDRLAIIVTKNDQGIVTKEISDDGVTTNSSLQLPTQKQQITIDHAQKGIYKVILKDESQGADIRIKHIDVNQSSLIFSAPIFLADTKPVKLITNSKNIALQAYHKEGLQTVKLDDKYDLIVNGLNTPFNFPLDTPYVFSKNSTVSNIRDLHSLAIQETDIKVNGDGYIAFSKEAYFNPKQTNFVDIHTVKSADSVDYIIANYHPVTKKGDWYNSFVTFSLEDFTWDGNLLYFSLEFPDLSSFGGEVIVDSLEVSVKKP